MADVIIVEDDPGTQRALHDVVSRLGHTVRSFREPDLAIYAIEQKQPDVLVTDWDLDAHLSGINIALYTLAAEPTARIILITGNDMHRLKQQTRRIPNVHYMTKPFDLLTVRRVITAACDPSD